MSGKKEAAVFLHIQKTAGTSLVHLAAQNYGNEQIISHNDYIGHTPESLMNIPFVSGHFGFDYAKPLINSRKSFTFLRNPAERILSLYHFYRSQDPDIFPLYRKAHESSLVDFLKFAFQDHSAKVRLWNNQTWQIANGYGRMTNKGLDDFTPQELIDLAIKNIERFTFVGMVENFEHDVDFVAKLLGWSLVDVGIRVNASQTTKSIDKLSHEEISLLEEMTVLDNILYDYIKSMKF